MAEHYTEIPTNDLTAYQDEWLMQYVTEGEVELIVIDQLLRCSYCETVFKEGA